LDMLDQFLDEVHTMPRMFYNTVETFGDRPAMKFKQDGAYTTLTYRDFADIVEEMGAGLLSLGLQKGVPVCLMAATSAPWGWADFAIQVAGGDYLSYFICGRNHFYRQTFRSQVFNGR